MSEHDLVHLLRNASVNELIRALERDGFMQRRSKNAARIYRHSDGRRVVIHYHHGSDTLTRKTLRSVLRGIRWSENDLARLGLLS